MIIFIFIFLLVIGAAGTGVYMVCTGTQPERAVMDLYDAYKDSDWDAVYDSIEWTGEEVSRADFLAGMEERDLIAELLSGQGAEKKLKLVPVSAGAEYQDNDTGRAARDVVTRVEAAGSSLSTEAHIKVVKSEEKVLFLFAKWKVAGTDLKILLSESAYAE